MAGAGQACVTLGALAALVGVIMGVVFMLSEEFVVANMQCNPDLVGAASNDSICTDGLVAIQGETCQIGNLGLYTASFTPDCLDSTPFEISSLITAGSSPTTEFPVLFPAQTGFSGVAAALNVPLEFESCETFFDQAFVNPFIETLGIAAVEDGFENTLTGLPASIKAGWDAEIDDQFAALDLLLFQGVGTTLVSTFSGFSFCGLPAFPATVDLPYNGFSTFPEGIAAGNETAEANCPTFGGSTSLLFAAATSPGFGFAVGRSIIEAVNIGLNAGNTFVGDNPFPAPLTGVDSAGLFAPFNSLILCGGSCTYFEYILAQNATLTTNRAEIELAADIVNAVFLGLGGDLAALTADATSGSPNFPLAFQIAAVKAFVDIDEVLPTGDLIGAPATATGSDGYAFLCAGVGLSSTCSFAQFLEATFLQFNASADAEDQFNAAALKPLRDVIGACATVFYPAQSDGTYQNCSTLALTIDFGLGRGIEALYDDVLGNFYGAIDTTGNTVAGAKAAAEAECLLDEQDKAAIAQAQILFPAGVGLSGAGLLVALLNLALFAGSGMSRWIGLAAGVLSLVGLVLALVALLGVYQAPIYQSLGAPDGPTPDGEQLFSSGIGFTYVLVAIGGAAVGAILISLGALFLKVEDPAVDIMKA